MSYHIHVHKLYIEKKYHETEVTNNDKDLAHLYK